MNVDLFTHQGIPRTYLEKTDEELVSLIESVKSRMGTRLFLPAHHYQKDEVVQFADATGDSLQLAQLAKKMTEAEYTVFCGVHFMAETADMLTEASHTVVLPDMRAGCSMADMANGFQTERAYEILSDRLGQSILPLTYVNSTAEIKAFVGRHGGATVTSSNAVQMVEWALAERDILFFLPDQHLGRNTAHALGVPLEQMAVWDPIADELLFDGVDADIRVVLWKGHCSVHEKFTVGQIDQFRRTEPDRTILVHPECSFEVVDASDLNGSTAYIIDQIKRAQPGTKWAIGTEMNLVQRLAYDHPELDIVSLNPFMCPCLTMNRIDLPHLAWSLEQIEAGHPVNVITVDADTTRYAVLALERMLERS
ncbi:MULTISPECIES: quinolinate synthase NadA [Exiguobacterium]|uniref:quinolinate synthase NadA n=1 Tax=Exiguobacterium TaxID=33986 RepID=UPI00047A5CEE|nr:MULTISPECIES: quinolinate synthase NadA [Exiguobacterium]MCT4778735.1 quinolinate synthase NadA [Exiguobacterium soli]